MNRDYMAELNNFLAKMGVRVRICLSKGNHGEDHRHTGLEILFVHKGAVQVHCGQWNALVRPGNAVILNGSVAHTTRPCDRVFFRTCIHVAFEYADLHPITQDVVNSQAGRHFVLSLPAMQRCNWAANQLQKIMTLHNARAANIRGLLGLILSEFEAAEKDALADQTDKPLIDLIINYMAANPGRNMPNCELATLFSISERQLHRLFQRNLGYTPQHYWRILRLEKACELLRADTSMKGIAAETGFNSLRGFEMAFRREYGVTPTEYRSLPLP